MSSIFNTDADEQKIKQLIDYAAAAITAKIVPALQATADELVDRASEAVKSALAEASAEALKDWQKIAADLRSDMSAAIGQVNVTLARIDGASVTVKLGEPAIRPTFPHAPININVPQ